MSLICSGFLTPLRFIMIAPYEDIVKRLPIALKVEQNARVSHIDRFVESCYYYIRLQCAVYNEGGICFNVKMRIIID